MGREGDLVVGNNLSSAHTPLRHTSSHHTPSHTSSPHTPSHSDEDHQREDWLAIHQKICGIVSVLRSPLPHASSQEEREHYRHQQTLRKVRREGGARE